MKYAQIRKMDISNGVGIGCSLFVQGCHFHCADCFNSSTWDFDKGSDFTDKEMKQLTDIANKDYIERVSILGGEPLCDENVCDVLNLLFQIKDKAPDKKIWIYTGYTFEEIINCNRNDYYALLRLYTTLTADVVVDGRFDRNLKDLKLKFRGSSNQRIIDIDKTIKNGAVTLLNC